MEHLLIYSLKFNIAFAILFMIYYFFLRKQKFLVINRFVLIGIVLVSLLLPIVPNLIAQPLMIDHVANNGFYNEVDYTKSDLVIKPTTEIQKPHQLDLQKLCVNLYLIIATIMSLKLIFNLIKLLIIIQKSKVNRLDGIFYCEPRSLTPPFSFFNYIVISKTNIKLDKYQQIVIHEQAHVKQFHSFDLLFAEVISIVLWINPLVYLYKRHLKLNLEFLADEATVNSGIDSQSYQLNLLSHSALTSYLPANYFFTSKLRERIYMINKSKPTRFSCNYFLLPFIVLIINFVLSPQIIKSSPLLEKSRIDNKKKEYTKERSIKKTELEMAPAPKIFKKIKNTTLSWININATTDTVKIGLVPHRSGVIKPFKGIYVIEDLIMSDSELREKMKMSKKLEFILPKRPQIGIYNENDSTAVRKWGKRAENGVIYLIANKS